MRTLKILSIALIGLSISLTSFSQKEKTETIKVSGNCGMCKKKIETAAKDAGAKYASWNVDTKVLTVKYSSKSTDNAKIQQAVAKTGYDTEKIKATDEAYNNLHACCKYERADAKSSCCDDEKCNKDDCGDMSCCKKEGSEKAGCCKKQ
jgi:hypothetical protein